jgi:hypothetical protein
MSPPGRPKGEFRSAAQHEGTPVSLLLLQLGAHPDEIAATKLEHCLPDGAFFLDFSRPLVRQRFCGVWNRWVGTTLALQVPVIHEGQSVGRHAIVVDRVDPYFKELQRLWQQRHPLTRRSPRRVVDGLRVEADFAAQFPDYARQAA